MKRIFSIILGIWCTIISFITPMWLTLTFLCITGQIYKYDDSMDEGTAGFFGVILLVGWLLLALIPCVFFIRRIYFNKPKYIFIPIAFMTVTVILCMAMCDWDIIKFWTTPHT